MPSAGASRSPSNRDQFSLGPGGGGIGGAPLIAPLFTIAAPSLTSGHLRRPVVASAEVRPCQSLDHSGERVLVEIIHAFQGALAGSRMALVLT